MAVDTSGLHFNAFYADIEFWRNAPYHMAEIVTANGIRQGKTDEIVDIPADALVRITGGTVLVRYPREDKLESFEDFFLRWKNLRLPPATMG